MLKIRADSIVAVIKIPKLPSDRPPGEIVQVEPAGDGEHLIVEYIPPSAWSGVQWPEDVP